MKPVLSDQAYPLPEAVDKAKKHGDFAFASRIIGSYLEKEIPNALRRRLELEKNNLEVLSKQYPYTYREAEELLLKEFPLYRKGMLSAYIENGDLDWYYIDGEIHLEARLIGNASARCGLKEDGESSDLKLRDENAAYMSRHGSRKARIRVRASLEPKTDEETHRNIPVVRKAECISDIVIHGSSPDLVSIDAEDAPMRTAVFEGRGRSWIEFSYTIEAVKKNIVSSTAPLSGMDEYLEPQAPHMLFTPYLRELAREITAGIDDRAMKARAIYDWITRNVKYSFVREYTTFDNISEFTASSLKGDCGMQAMLFITLCRIAGIPARWQSGWYVTPEGVSCHDWAEFYLPEYSWCFSDCSFGGGAYRSGKMDRWNHYFGSGDVFRMVANNATGLALTGKKHYPSDPTDNQRGEAETEERALRRNELGYSLELIGFGFLDKESI